jgi:hypothetical protein
MGAVVPFILFLTVAIVWFYTAYANSRLLNLFRKRYYDEANGEIPYAHAYLATPWKAFYFLSSKSKIFLEKKGDSQLLGLRARYKMLVVISILYPPIGFTVLLLSCLYVSHH